MTSQPAVAALSSEWEECADWVPDVFACLWRALEPMAGEIMNDAWGGPHAPEAAAFVEMLRNAADAALPDPIRAYLKGVEPLLRGRRCAVPAGETLQRAYVVAAAIDRAFETIRSSAFRTRHTPFNGAMGDFRRQWLETGSYSRTLETLGHVIAKGPLRRGVEDGGNGDNLENLFVNLTVALPNAFGTAHSFSVRVLPPDMSPSVPDEGRLGFVPLAEGMDDLTFRPVSHGSGVFLDVVPADEAVLVERARVAVARLAEEKVNIALFPELCVSPAIRKAVREALPESGSLDLLVLGSGASSDTNANGRHYNECVVLNGSGEVLWSQRKMNGYSMSAANMVGYDVAGVEAGKPHREWTASAKHLVVVDTAEGRRIIVLICEDLNQDKPGRLATRLLRPDWIFSPVLDGSLRAGRWTQRRGWDLSSEFASRVVVSNSMTLHARARAKDAAKHRKTCGIGVCIDDRNPRNCHVATVSLGDASPVVSVVDWKTEGWKLSTVTLQPPEPAKV